jgi:hypothetical protein
LPAGSSIIRSANFLPSSEVDGARTRNLRIDSPVIAIFGPSGIIVGNLDCVMFHEPTSGFLPVKA